MSSIENRNAFVSAIVKAYEGETDGYRSMFFQIEFYMGRWPSTISPLSLGGWFVDATTTGQISKTQLKAALTGLAQSQDGRTFFGDPRRSEPYKSIEPHMIALQGLYSRLDADIDGFLGSPSLDGIKVSLDTEPVKRLMRETFPVSLLAEYNFLDRSHFIPNWLKSFPEGEREDILAAALFTMKTRFAQDPASLKRHLNGFINALEGDNPTKEFADLFLNALERVFSEGDFV